MIIIAAIVLFSILAAFRDWRVAQAGIGRFADQKGFEVVELKKCWFVRDPFDTGLRDFVFCQIPKQKSGM